MIGKTVKVVVDRPIGSYHPEYKDMYYPINYGYVEGIYAADGEEQDAYILGVNESVTEFVGKIIAVIHRFDDVEEKWVVAPKGMVFTKEEIQEKVAFQEQYFNSEIRMKNIIHIFGASGSGTSTLGRKICEELGYTFMDTDDYFWLPTNPKYTQKRPIAERLELMRKDICDAGNVVISGSLTDWGDVLIPQFTLAIRLETDKEIRIDRLRKREKEAFGSRIEPGGDMYKNHIEFIEWANAYDEGDINMRSKAKHDEWQKLLECQLLHLNGADELNKNLEIIKGYL